MANDPYTELGVSRSASADEIRKSFRKLAKQLHPDQNPGDKAAEERFKRVSAAFDILGDPAKKAKFDKGEIDADGREQARGFDPNAFRGGAGFDPGGFGQGGFGGGGFRPGPGGPGGFSARFEGADFDDILSEVFSGRGPRNFSPKGADVRSKLEIELEEAILGGPKRVAFPDGRTLDITIPKGAADGQVLRLKGQGQAGRAGPGDALIELSVKPHPVFRREGAGADLVMDLPVSIPDAVLGAKVEAPTPDGPVSLQVPRRTSSGAVLRLKGRGAADAATGKRGDLLARVMHTLPDEPDPALDRFAETWRRDRPYVPKRRR